MINYKILGDREWDFRGEINFLRAFTVIWGLKAWSLKLMILSDF